jgi:group I intron endonuclease
MTKSYSDPRKVSVISIITRNKISKALIGRKHSLETKIKMSKSRMGIKNYYFGKKLSSVTLEAARLVRGKRIYVYSADNNSLVNNSPFLSIRETVNYLPISTVTLKSKLDKGVPFKGFFYYSNPK